MFFQLAGKFFVLGQHADGTFAGIYIVCKLLDVGDGGVGVVVERRIFKKFPGAAFARIDVINHHVQLVHGGVGFLYNSSSENSLPSVPLPWATWFTSP